MDESQSMYDQPHPQEKQQHCGRPIGNRNKPQPTTLHNLVEEDTTSSKNLQDKDGIFQDV